MFPSRGKCTKNAELGWKKGVSGGSEVMEIQINSTRVAEFLYMR